MPELLIFAPCEKAVVDTFTNQLSLVGIMDQISPLLNRDSVETKDDEELPQYLLAPFFLVTLWRRSDNDALDTRFEQCIVMTSPDGRQLDLTEPMAINLGRTHHRVIQETPAITARKLGRYELTLKTRKGRQKWKDTARFAFFLKDFAITPPNERRDLIENPI